MDSGFLSFEDWVSLKEHLKADWIVVGQWDKPGGSEMKATFSALTRDIKGTLGSILTSFDWDVSTDLGKPHFHKVGKDVVLDRGDRDSFNGVTFEAFTIYRDFHEVFDSRLDITQDFILYHNLHYDLDQETLSDPLKEEDVVKWQGPLTVLVKPDYLKEYLAARRMVLVRFHDHRRFVKQSVQAAIGKESDNIRIKNDDRNYEIHIGTLNGNGTFSRLLGKDVILPFKDPSHEEYRMFTGTASKEYATFILGKKHTGELVESTCNEDTLSNNFVDRGAPRFLTPIFFKR